MVALISGGPVFAAETLGSLQKSACENRDLVKRYQADLDILVQQETKARGEFFPSLDLGYTLNRLNHDTATGETRKNDTFSGGVSWNLFAGFKDYYNLKAVRSMTRAGQFRLDLIQQDIRLNVAMDFLGIYRSMENLKVGEAAVKLYGDRLRQIDLKVKVGVLRKTDFLKVKVEMDNAVQTRRRVEAAVAAGINRLSFEVGRSIERTELDFSIFNQLPEREPVEGFQTRLLANRSDLNALKMAFDAAEMTVSASRASLYPRADLSFGYSSHTRDAFFPESFENSDDEVRCQAVISMNLFDGMKKYAVTRQARLEQQKIKFDIRELEETLKTELENILLNMDVAFDNLAVAKTGTVEAKENLRITDLSFGQGIGTSTDVLDAIFGISRARFNLVTAYTEVFDTHFRLRRLLENF
jgi:outer membrane protein TolC